MDKTAANIVTEQTVENNDNVDNPFDFLNFDEYCVVDANEDVQVQLEVKNLMDSLNVPDDVKNDSAKTEEKYHPVYEDLQEELKKEMLLTNELLEKSQTLDRQLTDYERDTPAVMMELLNVTQERDQLQDIYDADLKEITDKEMKVRKLEVEVIQFTELKKKRKEEMKEIKKVSKNLSELVAENESLSQCLDNTNAKISDTCNALKDRKTYQRKVLKKLAAFVKVLVAKKIMTSDIKEKFSSFSKFLKSEDISHPELEAEISELLKLDVLKPADCIQDTNKKARKSPRRRSKSSNSSPKSKQVVSNEHHEINALGATINKREYEIASESACSAISDVLVVSPRDEHFDYKDHFFDVNQSISSDYELNVSVRDIRRLRKQVFKQLDCLKAVSPIPQKYQRSDFSNMTESRNNDLKQSKRQSDFKNEQSTSYQSEHESQHLALFSNCTVNKSPKRPQFLHQQSEGFSVEQNEPSNFCSPDALTNQCHSSLLPSPCLQNKEPYRIVAKRLCNGSVKLDFNISNPLNLEIDPKNWDVTCTLGTLDEESDEPGSKLLKYNNHNNLEESEHIALGTLNEESDEPASKQTKFDQVLNSHNHEKTSEALRTFVLELDKPASKPNKNDNKLNNHSHLKESEHMALEMLHEVSNEPAPKHVQCNEYLHSHVEKPKQADEFCLVKYISDKKLSLTSNNDNTVDDSVQFLNAQSVQSDFQYLGKHTTIIEAAKSKVNDNEVVPFIQEKNEPSIMLKCNKNNQESAFTVAFPVDCSKLLRKKSSSHENREEIPAVPDNNKFVNDSKSKTNVFPEELNNNCKNYFSDQCNNSSNSISNKNCEKQVIIPKSTTDHCNLFTEEDSKTSENVELMEENVIVSNKVNFHAPLQGKVPVQSAFTGVEELIETSIESSNRPTKSNNKPTNFDKEQSDQLSQCQLNHNFDILNEKKSVDSSERNRNQDCAFYNNKSILEEKGIEIENYVATTNNNCDEIVFPNNNALGSCYDYNMTRHALIQLFRNLEKLKNTTDLENACVSFTKELLNPRNYPNISTILRAMIEYLSKLKKVPLHTYRTSKDTSVLLPVTEQCIINTLCKLEKTGKEAFAGILQIAMHSLYFILPFKEQISLCGLSALCRVFTKICKILNCSFYPLMLCNQFLKMKHKFAPYLIASIISVWSEQFQVIPKTPDIKKVFLQCIAYGISQRPKELNNTQWKNCTFFFSKYLCLSPEFDVDKTCSTVKCSIVNLLQNESFGETDFMLSSPLVIFSAFESWEWIKEKILDSYVLPCLRRYATDVANEKAFKFFCHIYTDILMLCPDEDSEHSLLMNLFLHSDPDKDFSYVQCVTAYSLMKLCVLRKQTLPKCLNDWLSKHKPDRIIDSELSYLLEVGYSIQENDISVEDVILCIPCPIQDI